MTTIELDTFYTVIFLALLGSFAISWPVFASVSMRPIEKKIRADNLDSLSQWDGPGWRVVWYAWAIFLPICWCNNAKDPILNPVNVKKYARKIDWWLAAWFFVSGYGMLLTGLLYEFVFKSFL
ncbi:MAG: hypothetical protein KKE94_04450 [Gammaproteobacteria bacterium]|jgi:hypothetical protein|uniref:hypothetical protein n=1 Tax=Rheinheimera sp. TaxID=1869214 RepID=UPI004048E8E8|nr:hypothetical protein [Gammaproteobacteria bacterium]